MEKSKNSETQFRRSRGIYTRFFSVSISLVAAIGLIFLTRSAWLPWIGELLVSPDTPQPADLIVVMGGDFWGHRVIEAADLALRGYAPHVLISGPDYVSPSIPEQPEGYLATDFLVKKGYPRELFWTFSHHARTTISEAKLLSAEFRRRHLKRLLIVTSNYHSRRCRILFHALLPSAEIRVVGVPEDFFQPDKWWKTKFSRQLAESEWSKLVGTLAIALFLRFEPANIGLAAAAEVTPRALAVMPGYDPV